MVNHTHCRTPEQEEMDNHIHLHTKGLSVCLDSAPNQALGPKQVLRPLSSCLINSFRTLESNQLPHTNVNNNISARSGQRVQNS